jgi:ERCC4-type nuclease
MTRDNDVGLLVIEKSAADPRQEARRIRTALAGLSSSFEVIVMTSERFDETRDVIGGIAWPASRYGRVSHEAA